jgi:hypothetical protein
MCKHAQDAHNAAIITLKADNVTTSQEAACVCSECAPGRPVVRMRTYQVACLSSTLGQGNSDPFASTPVPVDAQANEYIKLCARFHTLWPWPTHISSEFCERLYVDWTGKINNCFHHDFRMHAMLAGGAYVVAARRPNGGFQDAEYAVVHKIQSMSKLRRKLHQYTAESLTNLLWTTIRLQALEFYIGNFKASLWHIRAAREIMRRPDFTGWDLHPGIVVTIVESWVCSALLRRRPLIPEDRPGQAMTEGFLLRRFKLDSTVALSHGQVEIQATVPQLIRPLFRDIRQLSDMVSRIPTIADENEKYNLVNYLDARAALLRNKVVTVYSDFRDEHSKHDSSLSNLPASACAAAAVIFLNYIFLFVAGHNFPPGISSDTRQPPSLHLVLLRAFGALYRDMSELQKLPTTELRAEGITDELMLWLAFIASLSTYACPGWSEAVARSDELLERMAALRITRAEKLVDLLDRFLYHPPLMDFHVEQLLRSLSGMESVSRSEWDIRSRTVPASCPA